MRKRVSCLCVVTVLLLLFGVTAHAQLIQLPPTCQPFDQSIPGLAMTGTVCVSADHSINFDTSLTYMDYALPSIPGVFVNGTMHAFVGIDASENILISITGGPVVYSVGIESVSVIYNTVEINIDSLGQVTGVSGSVTINGVTIPADPAILGLII